MFVAALLLLAVAFRLMWDRFLDPFEDGYQNWWIASSFVETGTYTDRFSQMTRGNWLPGYEFFAAGLVALLGSHIMPLLKASNIFFSLGTTAIVYLLARPRGQVTAALAAVLFAVNPADIVISSFATPEALALLTTFSGLYFIERRPFGNRRSLIVAATAFLVAATLRYEVWGFVGLYMLWSCRSRSITRRELAILAFPAAAFALAWFVWTSQYGFLPSMIIAQTSTDVQYKESVGTLAPVSDRLTSFFTWYLSWTPLALVAIGWLVMRERKSVFTGIIALFYGAEILYTAAGFGNPSPRYIHLTVPIICICSANGITGIGAVLNKSIARFRHLGRWAPTCAALIVSLVLAVQVSNPSPTPGFMLSGMQRAGLFLSGSPLPEGKVLISESSIAAYYSGYPASRILGSSALPGDQANASAFLLENAAFVVMVTVPYYKLRTLFPDQANGVNGYHLVLLYDATGAEFDYGAPRVLVFAVVP
ncbi:MAG TPA: hypothetical protein VEO96_08120 [Thermoplasmata archaeon]|nr:hypothetical protein [Thermoplasmata archaeon]